jgi:NAD-dependent SIR2 family protein deacetylase
MRVDWRTYPENIGHLTSPGCFRCHDGLHVDPQGRAISTNCDGCHTFLNAPDSESTLYIEGEFQHSMQLLFHGKLRCTQCHNGGELPSCRDCHGTGQWLEQAGQGQFRPEGK